MNSEDAPPAWAQRLMDSVAELQAQFRALQLGIDTPAPLPAAISADALEALVRHPHLADTDRLYARLLQITFPLVSVDDDCAHLQQCYTELTERVSSYPSHLSDAPQATTPPPTTATPPPGNVYVSRRGRRFDTTQAPPYPCRRCNGWHWAWTPCIPEPQQNCSSRRARNPSSRVLHKSVTFSPTL